MKVGCRPLSFSQFIGFIHISRTKFVIDEARYARIKKELNE